jgi:hypothetical protein
VSGSCEHCGVPMRLRTVGRGPRTGQQFWGSSAWSPKGQHSGWKLGDDRAGGCRSGGGLDGPFGELEGHRPGTKTVGQVVVA